MHLSCVHRDESVICGVIIDDLCFRRGINPPHRVKSVSMTTFSTDEVQKLRNGGNEVSFGRSCGDSILVILHLSSLLHSHNNKLITSISFQLSLPFLPPSLPFQMARMIWMGRWDPRRDREPSKKDEQAFREFLRDKYERKKWYRDPSEVKRDLASKSPEAATSVTPTSLPSLPPPTQQV